MAPLTRKNSSSLISPVCSLAFIFKDNNKSLFYYDLANIPNEKFQSLILIIRANPYQLLLSKDIIEYS